MPRETNPIRSDILRAIEALSVGSDGASVDLDQAQRFVGQIDLRGWSNEVKHMEEQLIQLLRDFNEAQETGANKRLNFIADNVMQCELHVDKSNQTLVFNLGTVELVLRSTGWTIQGIRG